jgi:hypothetical protein
VSTADALDAVAAELATATAARVWVDPFWNERFGARGLAYTSEDGRHHVTWLCEALRTGSADALETYARWLQGVLTTRGMCSLHLAEHFGTLAAEIRDRGLDPDGEAARLLDRAATAVIRRDGPAARIVTASGDDRELRILASYLGDAIANERPDLFVAHVRFSRARSATVDATLRVLAERFPEGAPIVTSALEDSG